MADELAKRARRACRSMSPSPDLSSKSLCCGCGCGCRHRRQVTACRRQGKARTASRQKHAATPVRGTDAHCDPGGGGAWPQQARMSPDHTHDRQSLRHAPSAHTPGSWCALCVRFNQLCVLTHTQAHIPGGDGLGIPKLLLSDRLRISTPGSSRGAHAPVAAVLAAAWPAAQALGTERVLEEVVVAEPCSRRRTHRDSTCVQTRGTQLGQVCI